MKLFLNELNDDYLNSYVGFKMSRDIAKRRWENIISQKDKTYVDRSLLAIIKEYCREAFGSSSYWPWIALYTELRGEFKEGWMPLDYYRFRLLPKMNPKKFMRLSEAKTIDYKLFSKFIIPPLFVRLNGRYYNKEGALKTEFEVEEELKKLNDEVIIKPDDGRGGDQITFINSKDLNLKDLFIDTDLIIQRVVKQHQELNKLNPSSINTFRVLTCIGETGFVKTKFMFLRFGIGGNRVDNISSGGGWIPVNLNGSIGSYAYNEFGLSIGERHSETGVKYSELNIPNFNNIIKICENAHHLFPYNRIIGWDVFIGEKGDPKLIEWNANNPAFWLQEAIAGPFFSEIIEY